MSALTGFSAISLDSHFPRVPGSGPGKKEAAVPAQRVCLAAFAVNAHRRDCSMLGHTPLPPSTKPQGAGGSCLPGRAGILEARDLWSQTVWPHSPHDAVKKPTFGNTWCRHVRALPDDTSHARPGVTAHPHSNRRGRQWDPVSR